MSDGIYSALSGAVAQQRALEVQANNVANINTTGFKGDVVLFREAVNRAKQGPAPDVMRYAVASQTHTRMTSGLLRETGSPLDVALQGKGFLALNTPNGVRYTTAGNFVTDRDGVIRSKDGHEVQSVDGGALVIPPETREITIASDGTLSADQQGLGQLRIVRFEDPARLQKEGGAHFIAPAGVQALPDDETTVVQGYLEGSNMHSVGSVTDMIKISRYFDSFQKVITTFKEVDSRTARELGRRF